MLQQKIQSLYEIYQLFLEKAQSNLICYQEYLNLAAQLYKHNMHNQIMVYGQNHNAKFVATEAVWNKIGRKIKPENATAIVTIAKKQDIPIIQHLYDIEDTTGTDVTTVLKPKKFLLDGKQRADFFSGLQSIYDIRTDEPYQIMYQIADKYVSGEYNDLSQSDREFAARSIAYILSAKLELDPSTVTVVDPAVMQSNQHFTQIGSVINSVSKMILDTFETEIERIRSVEHERNAVQNSERQTNSIGQLPRSEVSTWGDWADHPEEYAGELQLMLLGFGNGGNSPRTRVQAAGRTQRKRTGNHGTTRRKEPSSADRQHNGNHTAPEQLAFGSAGIVDGGNQSADLAVSPEHKTPESRLEQGGFSVEPHNYHTDELSIDYGGAKTKYKANVTAIRLMKQLEQEQRNATPSDQSVLARYTGWGGIPQVFDDRAKNGSMATTWGKEYKELAELLSPEEYRQAKRSTLNAHYTSLPVINAIYRGLQGLGFKGGKILEPSMATGNFFSVLPDTLKHSQLYGVELDSISGRIAQHLYPQADIQITGFQDTLFDNNYFDLCIGNIPFGNYKVYDKHYNKDHFFIHDYFIQKSLDKTKPGGLIAYITTKGTLDKTGQLVRKYIAQRAELVGAVRLPNNSFKNIANTEVTTDILFLKKREKEIVCEPNWIHLGLTNEGIPINEYYIDHPDHVLGTMVYDKSMYGNERKTSCHNNDPNFDLISSLNKVIDKIVTEYQRTESQLHHEDATHFQTENREKKFESAFSDMSTSEYIEPPEELPADPEVKNFTYTFIDHVPYYRDNTTMIRQDITGKARERLEGLHYIRVQVKSLIDLQRNEYLDEEFQEQLKKLNQVYDKFIKSNGYINDRANKRVFRDDADFALLLSLEDKEENKESFKKAAIFYRSTIRPRQKLVINTAFDALAASMNRRGKLDLDYMLDIYPGHSVSEIVEELGDKIYYDPANLITSSLDDQSGYVTAEEYLSGNVKQKLDLARLKTEEYPELKRNVIALEAVQPRRLNISDIQFSIGSPWIPLGYVQQFCYETFNTPNYVREVEGVRKGRIYFSKDEYTTRYAIYNKGFGLNIETTATYGTSRKNAYEIVEDCLNLKQSEVKDTITVLTEKGEEKEKWVLNAAETQLAQIKQAKIQQEFVNWILKDLDKVQYIEDIYNERFNVFVTRKYDGSSLEISGMAQDISLRPYQRDAAMRILLGGNTLLAHEVGAGKTYSMIAAIMLRRQTGLSQKSLVVVPNYLTEQWGKDFLKVFPDANILIATKKDFLKENRKQFLNRIATGDYDAVIISYTQFERIPMSEEYQAEMMRLEIEDITNSLQRADKRDYSVKRLENQKANLEMKIKSLMDSDKKDDVLTFEQLGIRDVYIDEFDYYKNCYIYTKIQNVAGLGGTRAEKSFDMLMKSRYLNKIENSVLVGATGTPISNSLSEMYVLNRYCRPELLEMTGLSQFDDWAGEFATIESQLEISPEGTGHRMRNRFAKFKNLPELTQMFSIYADVKLIEDLDIPRPKIHTGKPEIIVTQPTQFVQDYILSLAERSEKIRSGSVDPSVDNMLKITNEGKAIAIDPRILFPDMDTGRDSKIYTVCDRVKKFYDQYNDDKAFQLVFLDTGLSLYKIMKQDLIDQGIPDQEIAFIHDAKTDAQKATLFEKCRNGDIRVLLGSTAKCGAGANVQNRLIAIHHVDAPWRPRDLTQRNGRGHRFGNMYDEIYINYYVTKGTFDAYLYQTLEQKQRYISQIMTNKSPSRVCDDLDDTVLSFAEVKACAIGDTRIRDQMELENEVKRLTLERASFLNEKRRLRDFIQDAPNKIDKLKNTIKNMKADDDLFRANKPDEFEIILDGKKYNKRIDAGTMLNTIVKSLPHTSEYLKIGEYCGLDIMGKKADIIQSYLKLQGKVTYSIEFGNSELGNIVKIENTLNRLPGRIGNNQYDLEQLEKQLKQARKQVVEPYQNEQLLKEKSEQLSALNFELAQEMQSPRNCYNEESLNKTLNINEITNDGTLSYTMTVQEFIQHVGADFSLIDVDQLASGKLTSFENGNHYFKFDVCKDINHSCGEKEGEEYEAV